MGPVSESPRSALTQAHQVEVEDTALAIVRFGSGAVGTIMSTTAAYSRFPAAARDHRDRRHGDRRGRPDHRRALTGQDGHYQNGTDQNGTDQKARARLREPPTRPRSRWPATPRKLADLLGRRGGGRAPAVGGQAGRDALEIICAVYESGPYRPHRIPGLMTVTLERLSPTDLADPGAQLVTLAAESIRPPGAAQRRRVNVADSPPRRSPGSGPCSPTPACGSPRSVADREDPGRRDRSARSLDRMRRVAAGPRTSSAAIVRGVVLHSFIPSGEPPGRYRAESRPDGRAGGGGRRRGPDARPRERERDLRGHPGPLRRPDRRGGAPPPWRATFDAANFVQCGVRRSRKVTGCSARHGWSTSRSRTPSRARRGGARGRGRRTGPRDAGALRDSGFEGFHVAGTASGQRRRYGGFSGPEAFTQAARALSPC